MANAKGRTTAATPPAKLPRGRPSAQQSAALTRSIVEVATRLFLAHGFDEVSMEAVAAQAGVPKNTLYKRYADKAELARAVVAAEVSSWSAIASRNDGRLPSELAPRLQHHVVTMLAWSRKPSVRAIMRLAAASARPGEDAPPDVDARGVMRDYLARVIAEDGPASGVRARDPARVATVLMALVAGWLETGGEAPPTHDRAVADAAFLVDILLRGHAAW